MWAISKISQWWPSQLLGVEQEVGPSVEGRQANRPVDWQGLGRQAEYGAVVHPECEYDALEVRDW